MPVPANSGQARIACAALQERTGAGVEIVRKTLAVAMRADPKS